MPAHVNVTAFVQSDIYGSDSNFTPSNHVLVVITVLSFLRTNIGGMNINILLHMIQRITINEINIRYHDKIGGIMIMERVT